MGDEKTNEKIETSIINKDIFYIKFKKDSVLTEEDFELSYQLFLKKGNNKPMKTLIEVEENTFVAPSIYSCESENFKLKSRAKAIVTKNLAIRMLVSQDASKHNESRKVKVFKTKSKAIEWLDSQD